MTLCGAALRGEVRAQRGTFLRRSIVTSAGVPGLAENWEEFIIVQVNLAFGASFAVNSGHMFFSKHRFAKFDQSIFCEFQVAKLDFLVGPIRTVIRRDHFDVFQFTAKEFVAFLGENCYLAALVYCQGWIYYFVCRDPHLSSDTPPVTWIYLTCRDWMYLSCWNSHFFGIMLRSNLCFFCFLCGEPHTLILETRGDNNDEDKLL